jgi:hypothetical protein
MSFILKALKKLENEKSARKTDPVEIDSAILAPDSSSYSSQRRGGKWTIIPLVLMAGAGIIFFFLQKTPPHVTEARKMASNPAPAAQTAPLAQTMKPQAERPEQEGARINTPTGQVTPPRQKVPEKRQERAHLQNDFAAPSVPDHQASFVAATPALTVSGIALQDDPAESMAVVNGALVKTGMTVGGALVDRIFLDRVRFKGNAGTFEVYLSK